MKDNFCVMKDTVKELKKLKNCLVLLEILLMEKSEGKGS